MSVIFRDLDLEFYSLLRNVEPVESLQHYFLKQNSDDYFRGAYFVSIQGDIVSNDLGVQRSESKCVIIKSCGK